MLRHSLAVVLGVFAASALAQAAEIKTGDEPGLLEIRPAGEHSIRVTLKPLSLREGFPVHAGARRARIRRAGDPPAADRRSRSRRKVGSI